jgi:hypothetical protein
MERFNQEELGRLFGHAVQLTAMLYAMGNFEWDEKLHIESLMKTALQDCSGIIEIIGKKAEEELGQREETES